MKEFVLVFLWFVCGIAAKHEVHLVPAHILCPNVSKDHDILLPDPHDCSVYYRCENGLAIPQSCPIGLEWCKILSECTLPILANCTIKHTVVTYSPEELATYKPSGTPKPPGSPSPIHDICPINGARIPDYVDCKSYYECKKHAIIKKHCPSKKSYSCWYGSCVDKKQADCILEGSQEGKKCAKNGAKLGHPDDCTKYHECVKNKIVTKQCGRGLEFNPWFLNCYKPNLAHCHKGNPVTPTTPTIGTTPTPSPTNDICPIPGATLPNPLNCHSYYQCDNDHAVLQECPPGLEYSCWDQECLSPVISECADNIQENDTCTGNGTKLANPDECNTYFECKEGIITKNNCDHTMEYNQWFELCLQPDQAHCKPNIGTTTTEKATITPSPSETENICPIEGAKLPNPLECNSYYQCKNKTPYIHYCPDGSEYSCWDQECLPDESANCISQNNQTGQPCNNNGDKLPNPHNCGSYYECVDEKIEIRNCKNDFEYNQWYGSCMQISLAHCNINESGQNTSHPTEPEQNTSPSSSSTDQPGQSTSSGASHPTDSEQNTSPSSSSTDQSGQSTSSGASHPTDSEQNTSPSSSSTDQPGQSTSSGASHPTDSEQNTSPSSSSTDQPGQSTSSGASHPTDSEQNTPPNSSSTDQPGQSTSSGAPHLNETESTSSSGSNPTITEPATLTPSGTTESELPTTTGGPSSTEIICPHNDVALPNPANCNLFYQCVNGTPTAKQCNTSEEFSSWLGQCVDANTAICIGEGSIVGELCSVNGEKLQYPQNCGEYYECVNNSAVLKSCPIGKEYNVWFGACYEPKLAHCHKYPVTETTTSTKGTTVTLSPIVNICTENGSLLPDLLDCRFYYECLNNTPTKKICPENLYYSCWDLQCVPKSLAHCFNDFNITDKCSDGDRIPNPKNCHTYYECINGKAKLQNCNKDLEYNAWNKTCVHPSLSHCVIGNINVNTTEKPSSTPPPSESHDICPIEGSNLPNLQDCGSYYQCHNNKAELKKCKSGYIYSCWDQVCLPALTANCLNKDKQEGQACPTEGEKLPNAQNCSTSYQCVSRKVQLMSCEPGLEFNSWYQNCTSTSLAWCHTYPPISSGPTGTTGSETTESTSSTSPSNITPSEPFNICPINGSTLPNELDCKSYYICQNLSPVPEQCPPHLAYDCWEQKCTAEEAATCINQGNQTGHSCSNHGEKLPNINSCSSYYQCEHGKVHAKTCPHGKFFNQWFGNCVKYELAHCSSDTTSHTNTEGTIIGSGPTGTTGSETTESTSSTSPSNITPSHSDNICPINGATLPNELDCKSYYICQNESPVPEQCPPHLAYDCWEQKCTAEEAATCINQGNQTGHSCSNHGEKLPNINSCSSYYQCEHGKVHAKTCPHGKFFNQWFGKCVKYELAHCSSDTTSHTNTEGTIIGSGPTGTTGSETTESTSSTSPSNITPSHSDNICPINGATLPNELDCKSYYICQNESPVPEQCPPHLAYDCWEQKCTAEEAATCINQGNQTGHSCSNHGEKLPIINSCTSYYQCEHGKVHAKTCPHGKFFNQWFGKCVKYELAHCSSDTTSHTNTEGTVIGSGPTGTTGSETTESTSSTSPSNITPSHSDNICPINGATLPNELDCKSYYICQNESPVPEQCPPHLAYDCWEQKCTAEEAATCINQGNQTGHSCSNHGEKLPIINSCTSYYQCEHGKVHAKTCPHGKFFNQWFGKCVKYELAHCSSDTTSHTNTEGTVIGSGPTGTTGSETTESTSSTSPSNITPSHSDNICPINGATLPNELDCKSYYICQNESPVPEQCPPHLAYDCWEQKCTAEEAATCINQGNQTGHSCSNHGEKLPIINSCSSYYQCEHGKVRTKSCPHGKFFNQWFGNCVKYELAHCSSDTTSHTNTEGTIIGSGPTGTTGSETTESTSSTSPSNITPSHSDNICPINGATLPNELDCKSYYICQNESPVPEQCPPHLAYDCWEQKCTAEEAATCINQGNQTGHSCSNHGEKLPNINSCSSYYQCEHGKVHAKTCPHGKFFNQWFGNCVKYELAHCSSDTTSHTNTEGTIIGSGPTGTTGSETTESTSSTSPSNITPSHSDNICPINGATLPNELDCKSYYICQNESPVPEQCPPHLAYDCWEQKCTAEEAATCINQGNQTGHSCSNHGEKLPNINNCSSYYQCEHGKVHAKTCPHGKFFNQWFGNCVKYELAHCSSDTTSHTNTEGTIIGSGPTGTTGSETTESTSSTSPSNITPSHSDNICPINGATLPNELDCKSYYICQNESPVPEQCPPHLAYDCWEQKCTAEEAATCINQGNQTGHSCSNHGEKLPIINSCSSYYQCEHGKVHAKTCPHGKFFNQWFGNCVKYELAHCSSDTTSHTNTEGTIIGSGPTGTTGSETTESTSSTSPSNITPSHSDNICPINGATLPNELDCKSYYICQNESPVPEQCPPHLAYDCWEQKCTAEEAATCINQGNQTGHSCSNHGEKLPIINSCSSYYQCEHGKVRTKSCPHGKFFNQWFGNCVKYELAHCSSDTTSHTNTEGTIIGSGPTGTTGSETTESTSSTSPSNITPSHSDNICPINGATLPNELDCKSYYICQNESPVPEQCPPHLAYDCWEQKCTAEEAATCINQGNQTGHSCSNHGEKLPIINSCSSYYQCEHGKVRTKSCPHGKFFNQWFGNCVKYELAHCSSDTTSHTNTEGTIIGSGPTGTTGSETTESTSSTSPSNITPSHSDNICPINGATLPNELDCKSYYICQNESPVPEQCPPHLAYDCWEQKCTAEEAATCINQGNQTGHSCSNHGEKLPNINSCSSYYQCEHGKVHAKTCPHGKFFNQWFGNCVKYELAHCSSDTTSHTNTEGTIIGSGPTGTTGSETTESTSSTSPSNITPSHSDNICPINGATLPNELDCKSYYICQNESPVPEQCPPHLAYDCWEQKCTAEEAATCINQGNQTGHSCSNHGEKLPNINSCSSYYQCEHGKVHAKTCPHGKFFNQWFGNCVKYELAHCSSDTTSHTNTEGTTITPVPGYDLCPIDHALLPNPIDCSTYYKCENMTPVLQECEQGFAYSCWDQKCLPASDADCIAVGSQQDKNCSKPGQRLPNIEDCSKYYKCENGKVITQQCLPETQFNKWFGICLPKSLSHCESHSTLPPPTTTSHPLTTLTPSPTHDICPINGSLLPNPRDCSSYYICENDTPIIHFCEKGLKYSCWDQVCLPPSKADCIAVGSQTGKNCSKEGQKTQNPDNCHTYYECVNGNVETKFCPSNYYYNKWFRICLPSLSLSHCKLDPIKPTPSTTTTTTHAPSESVDICPIEGALLPDPMNCNAYYKCVNQSAVIQQCPTNEEYSCWDQMCKPATDAECINSGQQIGKKCSKEGEKLPDPTSCSSYYQCLNGVVEKQYCFLAFRYNKWYGHCVLFFLAHCNTSTKPTTENTPTTSVSQSTPTPSPIADICPMENDLLPNPANCSTYYRCQNNTPILQLCADGLEYSCWDQTCLPPQTANCIAVGTQTGKKCSKNGERMQNPDNCHSYYQCINGKVQTKVCSLNWYYNKWFRFCLPTLLLSHCKINKPAPTTIATPTKPPQSNKDICPSEGSLQPDPKDCKRYYKCEKNKAKKQHCPTEQEYSCWDQTCLPAKDAHCIAVGSQEGLNCSREGERLPNIENCYSYFECCKGKVVKQYCAPLLQYNKWYSDCRSPKYAHCKTFSTKPTPTTTTTTTTANTTTYKPPTSVVCQNNGAKVPNPKNCKQYFVCDKGSPVLNNCPPGYSYDCWNEACNPTSIARCVSAENAYVGDKCTPNGRTVPKVSDCNKYYECAKGRIVEKKCEFPLQYSVWRSKCLIIGLAKCANNAFLGII